jgi:hypothetical protein
MKLSLKNQIAKCSEIRKDFKAIDVTNLFSKKDIDAHWNPDIETSKNYVKVRGLFEEEYPSTESYISDDTLYFRFNNTDFSKLLNYVETNTQLDVSDIL